MLGARSLNHWTTREVHHSSLHLRICRRPGTDSDRFPLEVKETVKDNEQSREMSPTSISKITNTKNPPPKCQEIVKMLEKILKKSLLGLPW